MGIFGEHGSRVWVGIVVVGCGWDHGGRVWVGIMVLGCGRGSLW